MALCLLLDEEPQRLRGHRGRYCLPGRRAVSPALDCDCGRVGRCAGRRGCHRRPCQTGGCHLVQLPPPVLAGHAVHDRRSALAGLRTGQLSGRLYPLQAAGGERRGCRPPRLSLGGLGHRRHTRPAVAVRNAGSFCLFPNRPRAAGPRPIVRARSGLRTATRRQPGKVSIPLWLFEPPARDKGRHAPGPPAMARDLSSHAPREPAGTPAKVLARRGKARLEICPWRV